MNRETTVQQVVRDRYAAAAAAATAAAQDCCGGSGCCGADDPISRDLYTADELADVPTGAAIASLGCGNPTALADLRPGETVLDLGSGAGLDVLLSARRVGPTGFVYGLDLTEEMLALARANAAEAGAANVEFREGSIEAIPLPDASVDVIISNCVVNLAADKRAVIAEALRVLRPGGRLAVTDIVVARRPLPATVRRSLELWAGCVAGALDEAQFAQMLADAGFVDISFEVVRAYRCDDFADMLAAAGLGGAADIADGALASAFVRARKPR